MLIFGSSKHNRESYPKKCFWTQEKETRIKFNSGLSANRPSNNWALYSKYSFKGLREVMISQKPSLRNYSIGQANQKEHDEKRLLVKNKLAIANCWWDISHILLWWLHTNSSKQAWFLLSRSRSILEGFIRSQYCLYLTTNLLLTNKLNFLQWTVFIVLFPNISVNPIISQIQILVTSYFFLCL